MIEGQEGLNWDRWRHICNDAETLGFDSLRRSDHLFSVMGVVDRDCIECWTSLAMAAEWTKRIEIGPMVSPMTFRHPALLARMAAAVDLLSNGRLVLGIGAGWNEEEHAAYGITLPPIKERMDRLEEGIAVIRALWEGGPVDVAGRYYPLHGATAEPRPLQRMPDSGRLNTRLVCPECGSWVYSPPRDGVVRVRGGTLDDTSWLRPTRHIWTRSKQPWITFAEGDEVFEKQPPA